MEATQITQSTWKSNFQIADFAERETTRSHDWSAGEFWFLLLSKTGVHGSPCQMYRFFNDEQRARPVLSFLKHLGHHVGFLRGQESVFTRTHPSATLGAIPIFIWNLWNTGIPAKAQFLKTFQLTLPKKKENPESGFGSFSGFSCHFLGHKMGFQNKMQIKCDFGPFRAEPAPQAEPAQLPIQNWWILKTRTDIQLSEAQKNLKSWVSVCCPRPLQTHPKQKRLTLRSWAQGKLKLMEPKQPKSMSAKTQTTQTLKRAGQQTWNFCGPKRSWKQTQRTNKMFCALGTWLCRCWIPETITNTEFPGGGGLRHETTPPTRNQKE